MEVNLEALRWIERIARHLERGFVFTIDYGYTARELDPLPPRHADELPPPSGDRRRSRRSGRTRHHRARPVHRARGAWKRSGLETVRFETLARTLLDAGEPDSFAGALDAASDAERTRRRMQLKTLLFGMGETFRTLIQRKR